MEKPIVVIIKSSPWKSAHLFRNHPEYSAIFSLIQRHGHKIRFVLMGSSSTPTSTIQLKDDVIAWDIQRTGAMSYFKYDLELVRILFRYRPHLIITLGLSRLLPVAIFSLFSVRSKYVPVFIGEFSYYGSKVVGKLFGRLMSKALSFLLRLSQGKILKMFALSRYVRDGVVEKLAPNLSGKIKLISYPISSIFSRAKKRSLPTVSQTPIILTIAGLEPRKGLDTLVKAVSLIPKRLKVIIKGGIRDAIYVQKLNKMVEDLNLRDSITFVTEIIDYDDLVSYYESATLFVLPTREDCLGVVLLEALHCNLPVVATSVGGIPDMIEDGVNGMLVNPDDPYELANAISLLLNDDARRQKLAKNARRVLSNRYYKGRITLEEALNQSVTHLELG